MIWHQEIGDHIHQWTQVRLQFSQEEQVVIGFEKDGLSIVAAIINVIVMVWNKNGFSPGHGTYYFPPLN